MPLPGGNALSSRSRHVRAIFVPLGHPGSVSPLWMLRRGVPEQLSAQHFVGLASGVQQLGEVAAIMPRPRRRRAQRKPRRLRGNRYLVIEAAWFNSPLGYSPRMPATLSSGSSTGTYREHAGAVGLDRVLVRSQQPWANVILLPGLLLVVAAVMAAVWGQPGWSGLAAVTDRVDDAAALLQLSTVGRSVLLLVAALVAAEAAGILARAFGMVTLRWWLGGWPWPLCYLARLSGLLRWSRGSPSLRARPGVVLAAAVAASARTPPGAS